MGVREIKFRLWDNLHNKMIYDNEFVACYVCELLTDGAASNPNSYPMQYTGLKDVNKKEVYENDIIVINGKKYQVVWGWGIYEFVSMGKHDSLFVYDVAVNGDVMGEVIGNIYENPELLR